MNTVQVEFWARRALFTDPITKTGKEKSTYHIPTYQALKGMMESVYWKPTIVWLIDRVRILNPIKMEFCGMKLPFSGLDGRSNDLAVYTYLKDVRYQVEAHFEWCQPREDLIQDRNIKKHSHIVNRMISRGGRRDIFFGSRECQGYVKPCEFGEDEGFYDNYGDINYSLMFHGFNYPNETGEDMLKARLWRPVMQNGIINFPRPDDKSLIIKDIRGMRKTVLLTSGFNEEGLLDDYIEEVN